MEINIRKSVLDNLKGSTSNDLKKTIIDAINLNKEITLPGLGVLFERLWQASSEEEKDQILKQLLTNI